MAKYKYVVLLAAIILIWGVNWTVTKMIVLTIPPIWSVAIRCVVAGAALFILQVATRQFALPRRGDLSVILVVSIFHMVIFGVGMAVGLQHVPVGRSIVLGYTTPLWVAPGAWLLLREPMPPARVAGVGIGIAGLLVLFNPLALDWSDGKALLGNGILLLSALSWAVSILFLRGYAWKSTPFQLCFWQNLLAAFVVAGTALAVEGTPHFTITAALCWQMAYNGLLATAFGFWAVNVVSSALPAATTSLALLATPVVGALSSLVMIGEPVDLPLIISGGMILGGIALGTIKTGAARSGE